MPRIPPRMMQLLDDQTDQRAGLLKDLYTAYEDGDLDESVFEIASAEILKQGSLQSAALGAGSWAELDEDTLAEIEDGLGEEFEYLDDFYDEIDAEGGPTLGEVGNRLSMYAGVTRAFFFGAFLGRMVQRLGEGRVVLVRRICEDDRASCADCIAWAEQGWRTPDALPYPGKGSRCGGNCRCGWEAEAFAEDSPEVLALAETQAQAVPKRVGIIGQPLPSVSAATGVEDDPARFYGVRIS